MYYVKMANNIHQNKTNIYILNLENGKYYIGKSNNIANRVQQHIEGDGSVWTRKYKPISVKQILQNVSPFEEDKHVKEYMAKYGIDNVRGGSYVSEYLTHEEYSLLQKEIWGAKDCCTVCGRSGHFAKDCYALHDIDGNEIENETVYECEICHREFPNKEMCKMHINMCGNKHKNIISNSCYRCGRDSHYASECYAKYDIDGDYIRYR
jgi:predicted GIY-YIG superfamily endonuclease